MYSTLANKNKFGSIKHTNSANESRNTQKTGTENEQLSQPKSIRLLSMSMFRVNFYCEIGGRAHAFLDTNEYNSKILITRPTHQMCQHHYKTTKLFFLPHFIQIWSRFAVCCAIWHLVSFTRSFPLVDKITVCDVLNYRLPKVFLRSNEKKKWINLFATVYSLLCTFCISLARFCGWWFCDCLLCCSLICVWADLHIDTVMPYTRIKFGIQLFAVELFYIFVW